MCTEGDGGLGRLYWAARLPTTDGPDCSALATTHLSCNEYSFLLVRLA